MRDIHVGKRGPEAAGEEQPDRLRKTVRFEQEASSAAASSDPAVPLEYLASGETQDRLGSLLVCRSQVLLMTCKFLRWMHSTRWLDKRVVTSNKCWNGIEEKIDAGDLKRREKMVENLTCPNALEGTCGRVIKQGSILCDTVLGTTLCEYRSAHEEIDVTSVKVFT